jgi:proteasome lid subunit RPN8/RPN11
MFTPQAWSRLVHLRDCGPTEVGGFGISLPGQPLVIADVALVPQECTSVTTKLDDVGVADYFDAQVDAGRRPEEFARVWVHSHPGSSPLPSHTDEETFARVFGSAEWALMFIVARGGATYARLRFAAGPGCQLRIPVEVDFHRDFGATDRSAWTREYHRNVRVSKSELRVESKASPDSSWFHGRSDDFEGWEEGDWLGIKSKEVTL